MTPPPDSLGYISEADRFITDIAGVAKLEREQDVAKREQMYHNRRMTRVQREEERWGTIELKHQIEQKRIEEMRENYSFARSNKTSMPYNPINLRYDDGYASHPASTPQVRAPPLTPVPLCSPAAPTVIGCASATRACDTAARCARSTCSGAA